MKIIKTILFSPYYLIQIFLKGFSILSSYLSNGFYFYFEMLFKLLNKIIPFSFFYSLSLYFKRQRENSSQLLFLIFLFVVGFYLYDNIYVDQTNYVSGVLKTNIYNKVSSTQITSNKKKVDDNLFFSEEMNYYRMFGKYSFEDISISKLKGMNMDTKMWITVDYTNINYPVLQTSNNDYYLNHSFDQSYSLNGWIFMDYRNTMLEDKNTIFYGHNLLNKTSFGSLVNLFSSHYSNIPIQIITENGIYTYQVFSGYLIDDEVYYLQNNFYSNQDYSSFLEVISKRNVLPVDSSVSTSDKIITLSTCTDDNKGRRVIHAKLISK